MDAEVAIYETIKLLTEMTGPSGQEAEVQALVESHWREHEVKVERNRTGSLIGRVGGSGPKVLVVAHADELCYLVRAIDPNGFLWLANGQAWTRSTSLRNAFTIGQRVRVLARSGELPGVIATVTGHAASLRLPEPGELNWDDFWVDTGLTRDELTERGVAPGTRIIWDARTEQFGAHVVGKALDDRVGVAILCELVRRVAGQSLNCQLAVASTVQEEIGLIGATALAVREQFDAAVILESGLAGDVPKVGEQGIPIRLGAGPVLVFKDAQVHYDHALTTRIEKIAAKNEIPLQPAVFGSYASDGAAFMRADIPAALLAFPTRYTHTPFETGHLGDIEKIVDLLVALMLRHNET